MKTRPDPAPTEHGAEPAPVASTLLTFAIVTVVVPGISVLALTLVARGIAAGWGPVLGGAALAATWPAIVRAFRELTGREPERLWRLPGWVWLGLGGAAGCALLF